MDGYWMMGFAMEERSNMQHEDNNSAYIVWLLQALTIFRNMEYLEFST